MIKLFTHNDLDGIGCILLAQLAFGIDQVDFESCKYEDINERVQHFIENEEKLQYTHCFITDISIREEVACNIHTLLENPSAYLPTSHFQLIDHHISADALNQYPWCFVKVADDKGTKCSGTSLFYDYLKGLTANKAWATPQVETFVEKIRRFDTWDWQALEDLEAKQLNDLLYILGKERFTTYWYKRLLQPDMCFGFDETQLLLLEINQNEINEYISSRNEELIVKEVFGYKAGIVFANRFQSELGNKLAELHPEVDFIAMINVGGGVSCRTVKEDINLATEIAGKLGGGGHQKAAGLPVGDEIREMVISAIFKCSS